MRAPQQPETIPDDPAVEIMAMAQFSIWIKSGYLPPDKRWQTASPNTRSDFRKEASAAKAALEASGFRIVRK